VVHPRADSGHAGLVRVSSALNKAVGGHLVAAGSGGRGGAEAALGGLGDCGRERERERDASGRQGRSDDGCAEDIEAL
jgi:hypothetical protein